MSNIIRNRKKQRFTVVDNRVYADNHLSFAAMGLLSYLLSKPDDWRVSVDALTSATDGSAKKSGKCAVYALLKELRAAGYVVFQKFADGSGNYLVFDEPQETPNQETPNQETPNQENPNRENPNRDFRDVLINTDSLLNTELLPNTVCGGVETPTAPPEILPDKVKPVSTVEILDDNKTANAETWQAYRDAYVARYAVEPIRNAQSNALVANLVKAVGRQEAPQLAAFYVRHNKAWYVNNRHSLKHLIADAQAIRTDWLMGQQMTTTQAKQTEKTQANFASHQGAMDILKAKYGL